ncbi:GIY-YIG nuclease family protein [Sphingopyxis terrae]
MGILYIGVTDNLPTRILAHQSGTGSEFCKRWGLPLGSCRTVRSD